jgi:HEAT repeat protein
MAKRLTVEDQLAALSALVQTPDAPDVREKLAAGLGSKVNYVAARAAEIAGRLGRRDLLPELLTAFDRLMHDPRRLDKGCAALTPIAKMLYEIGEPVAEPQFLAGIAHTQLEASFGPPVDVAAELRGLCALGLVRIGYRHVMLHLIDLLDDGWPQARMFAARALAYSERSEAGYLLRFKLLKGDMEPSVMTECMNALLPFRHHDLPQFLRRFLVHEEPEIRTSAALALGQTRLAESLDVLRDHFPRELDRESRQTILLAISTLRLPQATAWLLDLIVNGSPEDAAGAIEALSLYRSDPALTEKIHHAARGRSEALVQRALQKAVL